MSKTQKTMYVGPSLEAIATRNTVFEKLPEALEAAIKKRPYLAGLCVPISGLAKALQQIDNQQGGVYTLYSKAESEKTAIEK
ncbi:MAG: hypothetical protein NC489_42040, partial [Ruminococcus flavefaciens]|nr:hypothetical protein [Ruminococcus flavefaciens]